MLQMMIKANKYRVIDSAQGVGVVAVGGQTTATAAKFAAIPALTASRLQ